MSCDLVGAVLLFRELHQAFGERLRLGILLRVELRAEFLVDRDAVGIGDGEQAGVKTPAREVALSHPNVLTEPMASRLYRFSKR